MGDAWGGDVSAYRREGEVELGPTTWLYSDSGCARASALGAAPRFPFQPRIRLSVSLAAKRAVPKSQPRTGHTWLVGTLCVDSTDPFAIFI